MHPVLRLGLTAVGLGLSIFLGPPARAADVKPNILVILADDLGYADVGFQGCKDIPTPHLDALARGGVRCTNGYVSHPFCSPTRAGLMTGRYQQRFGHENNPAYLPDDPKVGLPVDQVTLAQVLKAAGYATGGVGKWHLGAHPKFHPTARGFDEWFGFAGGGHVYLPNAKGGREYTIPLQRNRRNVDEKEYLTDAFSREAAAFINRHKGRPWFLYLAYNAVHTPLQAPPRYLDRVKHIPDETRRKYAALAVALDDGVGRVLKTLRAQGLERKTLVFFLSDNGGPVRVTHSSNGPLRGHKGQVFEGGIRVPFVVAWPGRLPAGKTFDEPVCSLDVFATAAALAGARVPADRKMDGVNLLPHLRGEAKAPPHERLFWRAGGGAQFAVREGRYKLAHAGGKDQLFDLAADVGETKDLAAAKPDVTARLRKAYQQWNSELVPPLWENLGGAQPRKR
jgi:arylsulfatase A-like enzyme